MSKKQQHKILCFHGWGTNPEFMSFQMRYFMKFFPDMEFIFMKGHIRIPERLVPDPGVYNVVREQKDKRYLVWKINPAYDLLSKQEFDWSSQLDEIIEFINKEGPFDGLCGFSQGGMMVQRVAHYIETAKDSKLKVTPPGFMIFCSAVYDKHQSVTLKVPSIHLIGQKDFTIDPGMVLTTLFKNPMIVKHAETHKFPKLNQYDLDVMNAYLNKAVKLRKPEKKKKDPTAKL